MPVRSYFLSRVFSEADLKHLDPSGETETEYHEEQRAIHRAHRRDSFDSEELNFPHFSEFRPAGIARENKERIERLALVTADQSVTPEPTARRNTIQVASLARLDASAEDLQASTKESIQEEEMSC